EFSRSWTYTTGLRTAAVSIDYPFSGWHDLTVCYRGQGWEIANQVTHAAPQADAPASIEAQLRRKPDGVAYLCFRFLADHGNSLSPPVGGFWQGLAQRAGNNIGRARHLLGGDRPATSPEAAAFQVQVFIEGYTPLAQSEQEQARTLFELTREALRQRVRHR